MAIAAHMVAPKPFPTLLIWLYLVTFSLQVVGYVLEKAMVLAILSATQGILMLLLSIVVMADDWCRFYLYRGSS